MDTHKKLLDSQIFRAALFTPIVVGLFLLGVTAYSNSDYSFCFSSDCINNFFTLYKYPLSIMGLGVPLSAIAAAVHRSEEASLQIRTSQNQLEETLKQNKFNNYIKHKEEFIELLERIELICNCKFNDPLHLYKQIFPKNSYRKVSFSAHGIGDFNFLPNKFLRDLKGNLWDLVTILYDQASGPERLMDAFFIVHGMTRTLKLSRAKETQHSVTSNKLIWPDNFSATSFGNLKYIIQSLASFSSFEEPDSEKRNNARTLMDSQGSGKTKLSNMMAIDNLASGIDDFL